LDVSSTTPVFALYFLTAFSVHLSDINMPGMTGLELLDEVQSLALGIPVIMVTAYGDEKTEADALQRGAIGLVSKPVDFAQLKNSLVDLLRKASP
jgi:DNA-binding NtrC family response regulator